MKQALSGIDSISNWSGKVLSFLILTMILILIWEIVSRYVFNAPTIWAHKTSQLVFGSYSVLAGAYVLVHKQHIRVDLFYARFSARGRGILDCITYLFFFLFVGTVLVYSARDAWHSVKIMEQMFGAFSPPVWPVRLTIPLAAALLTLQGLAGFSRALSMARRGKETT